MYHTGSGILGSYVIMLSLQQMRSDQNKVTLKRVDLDSAGVYRCEISAEAPLFNTVSRSSEMGIIGKSQVKYSH